MSILKRISLATKSVVLVVTLLILALGSLAVAIGLRMQDEIGQIAIERQQPARGGFDLAGPLSGP